MVTSITVKINGLEYNLKGTEDEEYLKYVAAFVEKKIQEVSFKNRMLTMPAASALAAVNIADELFKANKDYNELADEHDNIARENKMLKEELSTLTEDFKIVSEEKARLEYIARDDIQEELDRLKEELSIIEANAKQFKKENEELKFNNKELKFNLQSAKYKLLDLEKKFLDSQINFATERKINNPLINAMNK